MFLLNPRNADRTPPSRQFFDLNNNARQPEISNRVGSALTKWARHFSPKSSTPSTLFLRSIAASKRMRWREKNGAADNTAGNRYHPRNGDWPLHSPKKMLILLTKLARRLSPIWWVRYMPNYLFPSSLALLRLRAAWRLRRWSGGFRQHRCLPT